jgi:hypothetical protein
MTVAEFAKRVCHRTRAALSELLISALQRSDRILQLAVSPDTHYGAEDLNRHQDTFPAGILDFDASIVIIDCLAQFLSESRSHSQILTQPSFIAENRHRNAKAWPVGSPPT